MKNKDLLATATLLAALAVVLGAFGAHGLKQLVLPGKLETYKTGVQYHFYHALAISLTIIISQFIDSVWIRRSAWFFIVGILLFSGSLYLLTYLSASNTEGGNWVGAITPLGGIFFILGWLALTRAILKFKPQQGF
jgi:uncharacterized membrane protein YgdD (TMEM256/DUF423 family)